MSKAPSGSPRSGLLDRRAFAATLAAATVTSGGAGATDVRKGVTMIKRVRAGVLDVAYLESGPPEGAPVLLLHGFPYDVHSYDAVAERLAAKGRRVIVAWLRGYGQTRFLHADTPRVGQQAALGADLLALLDALRIERATLAGYDWGGRAACVVAALHPGRVSGLVSGGNGYNIQTSGEALKPVAPETERRHWYWFYLNSERGAKALNDDRAGFCRQLWREFSPIWHFDEAAYARTAASFDNPDFTTVVLHSYRYRIGAAPGDPSLEGVEAQLSLQPKIEAPTIVLEGADDGVDPPADPSGMTPHFAALRRRTVLRGVGHDIPQEAPVVFADAVLELGL